MLYIVKILSFIVSLQSKYFQPEHMNVKGNKYVNVEKQGHMSLNSNPNTETFNPYDEENSS